MRRYWWVLALALVFGGASSFVVWNALGPVYLAEGALWIEVDDPGRADQGPIASGRLLQAQNWVDLLTTFAVLDPVVAQERLHIRPKRENQAQAFANLELEPEFTPGTYVLHVGQDGSFRLTDARRKTIDSGQITDGIGKNRGMIWTPTLQELGAHEKIQFTLLSIRDASAELAQELEPRMDERGSFIRIRLSGTDPQKVASVLNTLMDRHVTLAAQLKRAKLDERVTIVEDQLGSVERELATAEGSLERFKVETITLPSERSSPIAGGLVLTRDPVFTNFNQMRVDLEQIRTDRERIRRSLAQIPTEGVSIESLEAIPVVRTSTQLNAALVSLATIRAQRNTAMFRYTPDHPSVLELDDQINRIEQRIIPEIAGQLLESLDRSEADMASRIAEAASELASIPPRTIQESQLQRAVNQNAMVYEDLSRRYEVATLEARSSLPDVRSLDRASVPEIPDHDLRPRVIALALALSLALGLSVIMMAERMDGRIRDPSEITSDFGLPILGTIPRLERGDAENGGANPVVEAFREIRLNTAYAFGSGGPLALSISSPAEGEGKSFVAANLAIAFAGFGKRTLLIDGDTRRGNLDGLLGARRTPGLVDYLQSGTDLSNTIQETEFHGLDLVASGVRSVASPELLGSAAMAELINEVRTRYQVVIVDCPPLSAGTDALILSTLVGHLAVVIRNGSTDRDLALAKLAPLQRLPVRVLGAILNDAKGSAYRYYSNYLPGYDPSSENGTSDRLTAAAAPPRAQVVIGE